MKLRPIAYFALGIAAVALMGQAAIQTFPPNSVWGRLGVGQYGPGGAIPFSTLVQNLGIGVPAHSVVIGTGTNGSSYNGAATGTAGQLLVDQGSGADPAFKPMSGSCTLASSGAISCSGVGAGVTAVTTDYTALGTDCLKTIAVTPAAQSTVTVNAASTYGACAIDIVNAGSWTGTPHGVVLNVSGLTTNPGVLYPGMTITLLNVNNSWVQKPGIVTSQAPVGTKLYVDGVNGNDANDCLSTASPCQTLQHVVMQVLYENLEAVSGSSTGGNASFDIRLIADPGCSVSTGTNCIHGLHMSSLPKRTEGHNSIMIECDTGVATDCTIADNTGAQAIGMYCSCFMELRYLTLTGGSGNNNAIQVEKGMVRIEGSVIIAGIPASPLNAGQLSVLHGGTIVIEGGATVQVSGGAAFLAQAQYGGIIVMDQAGIQYTGDATYTSTLGAFGGTISANGMVWTTTGHTVGATNKLQCSVGGFIDTGGGVASVPGTTTALGCSNSANGTYN